MEKKRDPIFDVAKAVAMFMVVYSHVMFYRPGFDLRDNPSYAINFIMVVAMPLFFMISGYFSRRLHESGDVVKLLNRFISYFWPLAFFGVLSAIIESLVCNRYIWTSIPSWALKKFLFCGWFFYALAGCELVTFGAFRFQRATTKLLCLLLFFCACLCGVERIWYIKQMVALVPFYWFGIWLLPRILGNKWYLGVMGAIGLGMIATVTFFAGNIATNGLSFYWNFFCLYKPRLLDVYLMGARYLVGMFGSVAIFMMIKCALCYMQRLNVLARFGVETLGMYFVSGQVIVYGCNRFVDLGASTMMLFAASFTVFVVSWGIVRMLRVNSYVSNLVWGFCIRK